MLADKDIISLIDIRVDIERPHSRADHLGDKSLVEVTPWYVDRIIRISKVLQIAGVIAMRE